MSSCIWKYQVLYYAIVFTVHVSNMFTKKNFSLKDSQLSLKEVINMDANNSLKKSPLVC